MSALEVEVLLDRLREEVCEMPLVLLDIDGGDK